MGTISSVQSPKVGSKTARIVNKDRNTAVERHHAKAINGGNAVKY